MKSFMAIALATGLGLAACGGSTDSDGTGGASGSGGSGGIDCSNVGCGAPPMCAEGCTSACGCCPCGEGEQQPAQGGYLLCTGGCWSFVAAKPCAGLGGATCAADEWCDLPEGCGFPDAMGVCKKRPQGCPEDCPGVCGCDGTFHCNVCSANAAGLDTGTDTSCMTGKACQNDSECAAGLKCCYPCGIPGCQNQCMAPMPNGMCPMFP